MNRFSLLRDLWLYSRQNKKYWLLPVILTLFIIGGLLIFAQGSAVAPFIYSLF